MYACACVRASAYVSVRATTWMSGYERAECFLLAHGERKAVSVSNLFASWPFVVYDIQAFEFKPRKQALW